ncbi:hypothetical protein niasHS_017223 [Heterodera schachtii]
MAMKVNVVQADGKDRMKSQTPTKKDMTLLDLQCNFPHVFAEGLGHCMKAKAHLELKVDAIPVHCRPRPVPFSTRLIVQAELDRLLAQKVIGPIDHTRWAAPIMVVKKANGAARVCADFFNVLERRIAFESASFAVARRHFLQIERRTNFFSDRPKGCVSPG